MRMISGLLILACCIPAGAFQSAHLEGRYQLLKDRFTRAPLSVSLAELDLMGESPRQSCWIFDKHGLAQPFRFARIEKRVPSAGPLFPEEVITKAIGFDPNKTSLDAASVESLIHQVQVVTTSVEVNLILPEHSLLPGTPSHIKLRKREDLILFRANLFAGTVRSQIHYGYCYAH